MLELQLDIAVTRGDSVESLHQVHAAVVDASGELVAFARNAALVTHWRSCAKPFQVMPMVEAGGFDALRWGDDQLAMACASHGGEPEHLAIAGAMLADLGLAEDALACGPHEPLSARGARIVRESGRPPTRLHNNCSGKHAAMLGRARTAGWPTAGYHTAAHEVQQACLASVSRWSGVTPDAIGRAVDGCGVVEYSLSLIGMATAYARLGQAAMAGEPGPARVVGAIQAHPFLVGGTDRFDTVLMEATNGRVVCKVGAEGVHSAVSLDRGVGVAIKAGDGATRAQYPALLRALQLLDVLPVALPPRLSALARYPLHNTRGEPVGEVRPVA